MPVIGGNTPTVNVSVPVPTPVPAPQRSPRQPSAAPPQPVPQGGTPGALPPPPPGLGAPYPGEQLPVMQPPAPTSFILPWSPLPAGRKGVVRRKRSLPRRKLTRTE